MTASEIHIEINILLQKIDTHWNKNFLPEEIDIIFNNEVLKFIKQRFKPNSNNKNEGIYDTTKRIDDLDALYEELPFNILYEGEKAIVFFPYNYLYYISSEVNTFCKCKLEDNSTIIKSKDIIKYKPIGEVSRVIFEYITTVNSTVLFDSDNLPNNFLIANEDKGFNNNFILNNVILSTLLNKKINIKYNSLEEVYEIEGLEGELKITTQHLPLGSTVITSYQSTKIDYNYYTMIDKDNIATASTRVLNEEFKTRIKKSYLSGSKDESVLLSLFKNRLEIEFLSNFIGNSCILRYLRKPKLLNVHLNNSIEFDREVIKEIISNTVQTIKGITSEEGYEKFKTENILIE